MYQDCREFTGPYFLSANESARTPFRSATRSFGFIIVGSTGPASIQVNKSSVEGYFDLSSAAKFRRARKALTKNRGGTGKHGLGHRCTYFAHTAHGNGLAGRVAAGFSERRIRKREKEKGRE